MTLRALVVEDDTDIAESVGETLVSLNHEHDWVVSQEEARQKMAQGGYAYVLLDLQIPVRPERSIPRLQNGVNLARELHQCPAMQGAPVIVMTAFGHEGLNVAAQLTEQGVVEFITKPFPKTGKTLDVVVLDVLRRFGRGPTCGAESPQGATPLRPFQGGELVLFPDHAELCGVRIITDRGDGHSLTMLRQLSARTAHGRFVRLSASDLGAKLRVGEGTITGCAKTIRESIKDRLRRECGLECGDQDVLARDNQGYHLNDQKIRTRSGDSADPAHVPGDTQRADPGDTEHVPADVPGDMPGHNERQQWVLQQLGRGVKLCRTAIEDQFRVGMKTAKRDLAELREQGLVEWVAEPRPGHYRLGANGGRSNPVSAARRPLAAALR
jgi:CheY-like chemotaxis protein